MIGRAGGSGERPATFFRDAAEFRAWLVAHHESATELWMGLNKKHVTDRGLTWEEAVPEALCFGWIDSQVQRVDEDSVRQRWTPRKASSTWSKVNIALVEALTAEGRMYPAGLAAYARRQDSRSAIYSYEQDGVLVLPDAYAAQLAADPVALAWWTGATPGYRKICVNWVLSAKQQVTRDKRMSELVQDCASGRLVKGQRYGEQPGWVDRMRAELGLGAE